MSMPRQSSVTVTTVGLESRRWYLAMPCRRLSIQTCYFPMTVPMSFLLLSLRLSVALTAHQAPVAARPFHSSMTAGSNRARSSSETICVLRAAGARARLSSFFGGVLHSALIAFADLACGGGPTDRPRLTAPRPRPACTRVRSRCRRNYFRVKKGARKRGKKGRWNCATHATLTADSERNAVARSFLARFARSLSLSSNRASRRRSSLRPPFICNLFLSSTFRRIT